MEKIQENFKSETNAIKWIFNLLFFVLHVAIISEFIYKPRFLLIFKFLFFLWFSIPYFKTIKNRYYTFWTFSVTFVLYLIYNLYQQWFIYQQEHIFLLYLLVLIFIFIIMYLLYSPLYYPRVSWWEYDFRYKDDLKIHVTYGNEEYKARLTDLRRQAGCVAMFEEVKMGEEIIIHADSTDENGEKVILRAVVMSKRKDIIGRPIIYGVQFKFNDHKNKIRYKTLEILWNKEKNNKKKLKFKNV